MSASPLKKATNLGALNIIPTPAAVAAAIPQLSLPRNKPTPTENIAIVAMPLAIPPERLATSLHSVCPTTSLSAAAGAGCRSRTV